MRHASSQSNDYKVLSVIKIWGQNKLVVNLVRESRYFREKKATEGIFFATRQPG